MVQPLFFFLAEQIDLAGQQAEEEPALRIAYCDVNESCCSPAAVYRLIKALKQQYNGSTAAGDLWQALQQVRVHDWLMFFGLRTAFALSKHCIGTMAAAEA